MVEPTSPPLPSELPVLPLRRTVVFPLTLQPLAVHRGVSIETINRALGADRLILLLLQENDSEDPEPADLRRVGTVGVIRQMAKTGGGLNVIVEGVARVRVDDLTRTGTSMRAHITPLPEAYERTLEVDAHVRRVQELVEKALPLLATGLSEELRGVVLNIEDPLRLAYVLATLIDIKPADKQTLLEESDLLKKLQFVSAALARELSLLELKGKIESQAQQDMTDAQRHYFLRQQLKAIQQELGEGEGQELAELRARVEAAALPASIHTLANGEVDRLARMGTSSPEYQMLRTYVDWLLDIPWSVTTLDRIDPVEARRVLDEDHYDLDKVKERIVEYLAVRKLKGDLKGPILCFVGPPGVGKTSLGQSIARAMSRKFVRLSLGGVRDEAEIRGHRRTYIGAIPGRIVQALKQAGSMNPVFMLDEMDKLAAGYQGDPAAALLEVLDPAQNHAFRDHYLEAPVDLSKVLFIATANQLGTMHAALLDRMEVIHLSGYSEWEKLHIARNFLLPRQIAEHGLSAAMVEITDAAVDLVIAEYTREAGVRDLERRLGAIVRKVAAKVATRPEADGPSPRTVVEPNAVDDYLGAARFKKEMAFRTSRPGVATGLAWTEVGGDVLFVEATLLPGGNQNIILTGQLGNVMQESARAALSHLPARAADLGLSPEFLSKHDLHVHVPAGAIPKDGPSAGVTMATAILSAALGVPVRQDVAMTGEITLSGLVLPVGGIREKALAARRFGIKTLILPALNLPDVDELPEELKHDMTFVPVETLEQVVKAALHSGQAQ